MPHHVPLSMSDEFDPPLEPILPGSLVMAINPVKPSRFLGGALLVIEAPSPDGDRGDVYTCMTKQGTEILIPRNLIKLLDPLN